MDALRKIPFLLARQRRRNALAGALRFAWYLIAGHLLALAVLGWFSVRHPLSPGWLVAMEWTYVTYLLLPFFFWDRWSDLSNSPGAVARDLDRANPSAPDPFRTSLSLANHDEATLAELDRAIGASLPSLTLPRPLFASRLHRILLASGAAALVLAAAVSGHPVELLRRAASPWGVLSRLPILRFHLDGVATTAGAGDTVKVRGVVENRLPGQALFAHVRSAAATGGGRNEGGEVRYPLAPQGDSFSFTYGPVENDFSLQFVGANGSSAPLRFRVVPPPFLEKIQVTLTPPGYTGLRSDTLPAGVAHFSVLPGTRVRWRGTADRALKSSGWEFRQARSLKIAEGGAAEARPAAEDSISRVTLGAGRDVILEREVRAPLSYAYWLEDEEGIRSRPSLPYRVDITPDQPPEVDWTESVPEGTLDRDLKLPLSFRVKDDFGVASLKLVYRVLGGGGVKSEGKRDCRDWLKQAAAGLVQAEWDVTSLGLRPENSLEFHLVATDNDTVSGPKTGSSPTRTVRLPTVQEVLAATRQKEQSAVANLKSAIEREKQLERKLERENQAPRDEAPPMLADYEINRIMVEDPRMHARRTEALLAHAQQSLAQMSKGGSRQNTPSPAQQAEIAQAQAGLKELHEAMKRGESSLPQNDQARLPLEERSRNLDKLMQAQQDEADKMAKALDKLAKVSPRNPDLLKTQLDDAAKDLQRNLESQNDLKKFFQDQAAQAKAKSETAEQANQEQMRMAEDMKSAVEDIQKSLDQGQRNGTLSKDLLEKMKKVQELLSEVLPDSLQKMLQQKASGQEVDPRELRDQLNKMMEKQAEMSESLTRALAMLEQLRDRKRMEDLKQQLSSLQGREDKLAKRLASAAGKSEEEEQKSIQKETQKALGDFSAQASGKKDLQDINRMLQSQQPARDMQEARDAMASASGGKSSKASSAAKSAAGKLGAMAQALDEALASMDQGLDISEANEILQESLALSRLQLLIGSGAARRQAEGWDGEDASLYASVAQTAQWIHERVKAMAAKVPFAQGAILSEARGLAKTARAVADQYSWETSKECLQRNQDLSRELLKMIKMAQSSPPGGGGGGGGSSASSSGQGQGQGQGGQQSGGSLSSQLKGMSGKQMAINSATYQLLQAMLEGRRPGSAGQGGPGESPMPGGQKPGGSGPGGSQGGEGAQDGQGAQGGQGQQTLPGMGNREGELGESLESLAEGMDDAGGAAQKVRKLAEEARKLEEDLRSGRITAEELRQRQERFQTRLLEASTALEERGMSEKREAEAAHGAPGEAPQDKAQAETRLLQLLREARKESKTLRLSESQRKYLEEYYDNLLTR